MVPWLFGGHLILYNQGREINAMNNYGDKGIGEDRGIHIGGFARETDSKSF
jgi:hypothetical protein